MKHFTLIVMASLLSFLGLANNVVISNASIINNGPGQIQIKFDLSWDNSWRVPAGPNNYDGVWVFFRYKASDNLWKPMYLNGNNNILPAGADVYQTNDFNKTGAVIYREAGNNGSGSMVLTNIKLGVFNQLPYNVDVKAFAIEMVFIPAPITRPFFGDGDGVNESLNAFHYTDNTATTSSVVPMKTDVNGLDDGELDADGIYVYSNDTIQTTNPLGALEAFPTMKSIWCMKYELSQAAYRDFLNTLTYNQQVARTAVAPGSPAGTRALAPAGAAPLPYRNYIKIETPGVNATKPAVYGCDADGDNIFNEATDGEWIACNYLTWPDVAAFLDWSGLAPLSELQYERICRGSTSAGPQPATYLQDAWGTSDIFGNTYTSANANTTNEGITNNTGSLGNAAYFNTSSTFGGPFRNGIFATSASDRINSGAAFYGVMEMSGNVYEYCITLGNAAGRSCHFIPNGNGAIADDGNAKLAVGGAGFWPGMEGNITSTAENACSGTCEVTGNAGLMRRGGSHLSTSITLAIAYRSTTVPSAAVRDAQYGGRGALYIR